MTQKRVRLNTSEAIGYDARVRAVIVGKYFAVHLKYSTAGPRGTYAVTHIPSGLACGQRYISRDVAIGVAEQLAALPIEWGAIKAHGEIPKRLRSKAVKIIGRAQLPVNY